MSSLYERLNNYNNSDMYRFHMPGHKGNGYGEYFGIDITEIDGFDNLHHPEGVLKDEMDKASHFYKSDKTYYLVNGSSCGILSAISAAASAKNGKIIMSRNSHKSAYNAVFLNRLEASYIYPQYIKELGINGGVKPEAVDKLIKEKKDVCAVFITSPTYEGIVSDIREIASIAHRNNIPLIVDEAHGAHFCIHDDFPVSAIELGADIVIQSVHKTLPSLTQTALLHIGKDSLIGHKIVERFLAIYQSSSPSYVLMSSISNCIDELVSQKAHEEIEAYIKKLDDFYDFARGLKNLMVLDKDMALQKAAFDFDKSKLVIFTGKTGISGEKLYSILREKYDIQPEMAAQNYLICMTSYKDSTDGFLRLKNALAEIDNMYYGGSKEEFVVEMFEAKAMMTIYEAMNKSGEKLAKASEVEGKIALSYAYVYPPGIPIIAPGEEVTRQAIEAINKYKRAGLLVIGEELNYE